jgi:proteasome lid subunit RPN8/RPN11
MEVETMFSVEIDKDVEDTINWFTNNYPKEISGWLVGSIEKDIIKVTDMLIPHQEVGGASVDTDGKALIQLRKEYGDKCLKIIGHFHSHNTMTNFWSTTDEDFMKQYMETREKALFIVSSKSNGHRVRLELRNPVNLTIDDIDYSIGGEEIDILGERLKKVIDEKVTEIKTTTTHDNYLKNKEDVVIFGSNPTTFSRENESYTYGLSDKEINEMIKFYNKKNKVVVSGLSNYQYGMLEGIGRHEAFIQNNKWEMEFNPKNKGEARRIMKQVREDLKEKGVYDFEKELEDLGY